MASVIGLVLAIYFYLEGREKPHLTYYVNPIKATLLKTGEASKLSATFDNRPVQSDITAAQVAIWNAGKGTIRKSNILRPVVISTSNTTPILEATIRKVSRDVVQLTLNQEEMSKGRLTVSWDILEQDDGGVIQVVYAGTPEVGITTDGIIEGQRAIDRLHFSGTIQSPAEQFSAERSDKRFTAFIVIGVGVIALIMVTVVKVKKYWQRQRVPLLRAQLEKLKSEQKTGLERFDEVFDLEWNLKSLTRREPWPDEFEDKVFWIAERIGRFGALPIALILIAIGFYLLTLSRAGSPPFGF